MYPAGLMAETSLRASATAILSTGGLTPMVLSTGLLRCCVERRRVVLAPSDCITLLGGYPPWRSRPPLTDQTAHDAGIDSTYVRGRQAAGARNLRRGSPRSGPIGSHHPPPGGLFRGPSCLDADGAEPSQASIGVSAEDEYRNPDDVLAGRAGMHDVGEGGVHDRLQERLAARQMCR